MKQDGRLEIRVNKETKRKVDLIATKQGIDLSSLVNEFLEDVAKKNRVPLPLVSKCRAKRKRRDRLLSVEQIVLAVRQLADTFGPEEIKKVYLFGSYSRNEAKVSSDVDVLIEPGSNLSFLREAEFNENLRQLLGKDVDTLTTEDVLDPRIKAHIDQDRRLIYDRR